MIYTPKNMREHALGIWSAVVFHHLQFIAISRIVLILCDSSKQCRYDEPQ